MKKQIPIIMDCDPGHDDAIALVLAAASPQLDIRCVTTTAGNQTLEKTTYNALRILTLLGRTEIPVAKGRKVPMLAEPMQAPSVHGVSGLDGPPLPEPGQKLSPLSLGGNDGADHSRLSRAVDDCGHGAADKRSGAFAGASGA